MFTVDDGLHAILRLYRVMAAKAAKHEHLSLSHILSGSRNAEANNL